jgi:arsenate reductase
MLSSQQNFTELCILTRRQAAKLQPRFTKIFAKTFAKTKESIRMVVSIYHNPRCSKSRQTLQLIEEQKIEPVIIEYLKSPPTKGEFKQILKLLNLTARQLLRKNELEYAEHGLDDLSLSEDHIIDIMIKNPKLIERPIVVTDKKAAIGRPPENVLEILRD